MSIDISAIPDAQFRVPNALFPYIIANEILSQQQGVAALNVKGKADWDYAVSQWTINATIARGKDAKVALPPKPVSPPSWVVLTEDVKNESGVVTGTWIAQAQAGPVYGVCPDLPAAVPTPGGVISNPVKDVLTQDQKLDSISATVVAIEKMLREALLGSK